MSDPRTRLIHHPYKPPQGFASPAVPIYKGSTVFFDNVAAMRSRTWLDRSAYTYGLHGTPTSFTLEERIATLEGGKHTMLVSSGLAAVTMVDIAVFFAVLLIGFAYVWRRGDLDWVRAVGQARAAAEPAYTSAATTPISPGRRVSHDKPKRGGSGGSFAHACVVFARGCP